MSINLDALRREFPLVSFEIKETIIEQANEDCFYLTGRGSKLTVKEGPFVEISNPMGGLDCIHIKNAKDNASLKGLATWHQAAAERCGFS